MANHEVKFRDRHVHLLLALNRVKGAPKPRCLRVVVRNLYEDIPILASRLKRLGGEWRIHHTVNARDTEVARVLLMHQLLDHPQKACDVESLWRTCLLQRSCRVKKNPRIMLDVDTQHYGSILKIGKVLDASGTKIHLRKQSPHGYHYIVDPFDTRIFKGFSDVTILNDGYYYLSTYRVE